MSQAQCNITSQQFSNISNGNNPNDRPILRNMMVERGPGGPGGLNQNESQMINRNQMRPQPPFMPSIPSEINQLMPQRSRTLNNIETFDRYGKKLKKDTSQGFMQLLNSGNIDGSFTGSFLYLSRAH